jgi:hypothetical protein
VNEIAPPNVPAPADTVATSVSDEEAVSSCHDAERATARLAVRSDVIVSRIALNAVSFDSAWVFRAATRLTEVRSIETNC